MTFSRKKQRTLFVTTALPYANGPFHIGHIMEYIQADIWVRFMRMRAHRVLFVCADDAHGAPIMLKAQNLGIAPEELIAGVQAQRGQDLGAFHIAFDHWHSTHSEENTRLSQDIYCALKASGLIDRRPVEQFFDSEKNMFLADRYVKGTCPKCGAQDQYGDACEVCGAVYAPTDLIDPYSVLSGQRPILKTSDHLFFKLSDQACARFLQEWTQTSKGHLQPEIANKVKEWLEDDKGHDGLVDWDISRDAPYFGIRIPDEKDKYFYVWMDAPVGYLASLKAYCTKQGIDFDALMDPAGDTEQIHFIGKDIVYFHALFWPAMLHFAGHKTPDRIMAHGFVTVGGHKMSKSRGTGLSPRVYMDLGLNPEWLRYYFAAKLSGTVQDIDFNAQDFVARISSDLVGKTINIASRCARFIHLHFNGQLMSDTPQSTQAQALMQVDVELHEAITQAYEEHHLSKAVRLIMQHADQVNAYFDEQQPWVLAKDSDVASRAQLHEVCSACMQAFAHLIAYLKPILPQVADQAQHFLNITFSDWDNIPKVKSIAPYEHLMQRPKLEQVQAFMSSSA